MSREEIACFLGVTTQRVEEAWRRNDLQRTLFREERKVAALAHSTVFDIIEFALAHGFLPVKLSREHAALWVTYLCEASEWPNWAKWGTSERAAQLLAAAMHDGVCGQDTEEEAKIALTIILTQIGLLQVCASNDGSQKEKPEYA
ncbi:MAG: hypothetical protein AAF999_04045 [Pseudomonadota bacterium]